MKIKRSHIAFAIVFLMSGLVFFPLKKPKPIIWLESHAIDLGLVSNYEKTYSKMRVENRGTQDLKLTKINTTCPCTQGKIDPDKAIIPPGGSAEIDIQLDPMRMGGFTSTKTLTIFSNDPQNPQIKVDVSAHVTPEFELVPPGGVNFETVQQGESRKATYLLRQLNDESLEIKGVRENPAKTGTAPKPNSGTFLYTYVLRPEESWLAPGKAEYDITVQVSPDAEVGKHQTYFFIMLNLKRARVTRAGAAVTIV